MAARKTPPRWRRSPPELASAFDAALPDDPRIERRPMFGFPCAFTGGRLFSGLVPPALHADPRALRRWIVRALEFTASMPPKKAGAGPRKKKGAKR